jgi:acetyltransferase-like isoleucine patch superfamily enzyme
MKNNKTKTQVISADVKLGKNVKIYDFVNLYGCSIGDNSKIGTFVEIQKNVRIGKNCKISSHTFICEGVVIEDNVFIGHNVTFINDRYPRATNREGRLQTEKDWDCLPIRVKKGASIGSSATILGGLMVGENAIVGAASMLTKNVPANTIVAGNPARFLKRIELLTDKWNQKVTKIIKIYYDHTLLTLSKNYRKTKI